MANTPQARKRVRQNTKNRHHNNARRSRVRTYIKAVQAAIASGDKTSAQTAFKRAEPIIDNSADKGIIHKNKAARHKSRLSAQIKALETASA
ncbi:MAG: 30S ribosomal protein S20 [Gammaproteobacteria bacterium]